MTQGLYLLSINWVKSISWQIALQEQMHGVLGFQDLQKAVVEFHGVMKIYFFWLEKLRWVCLPHPVRRLLLPRHFVCPSPQACLPEGRERG